MMLGETVLRTAIREHNADGTWDDPDTKNQSQRKIVASSFGDRVSSNEHFCRERGIASSRLPLSGQTKA